MRWNLALLIACGLTLATAHARDYDITKAVKTKEGCVFYTYPEYDVTTAAWEGKCTPGAELDGPGTLRYEARYMDAKEGFIGTRGTVESGGFKAGRLEGPGSRKRDFFDKEGRKYKEITSTGHYRAGWQKGQGESARTHIDAKTGQAYQRVTDKGNFDEDYAYKEAQRVVTSPSYKRFGKKILDAEFYPGGDIRWARVTFTKTVLGGDIVFEDVMFKGDGHEDTITGFLGGFGQEEIEGTLRRPGNPIRIRVKWADLNEAERFLNSFTLIRDNWTVECFNARAFGKGMMQCGQVEMHVKQPEFDFSSRHWDGELFRIFDLSHIESERHPNPELQAMAENALAAQRAGRQLRQEEAERKSAYTRDEFQSCVRMSRQLEQMQQSVYDAGKRLDDTRSSIGTLKAMLDGARSNGLNVSYDIYNRRVDEFNGMAAAYKRDEDRLNDRIDGFNASCARQGSVPKSYVADYCSGSDTRFCKDFQ